MFDKRVQREDYVYKSGLDPIYTKLWVKKWKGLGSPPLKMLSFEQYIDLAVEAGIKCPDEIGLKSNSYQMGRIGDTGIYELGNCRFISKSVNMKERDINGGTAVMGSKRKGQNKSNSTAIKDYGMSRSKSFIAVSPEGVVYQTRNVTEFCESRVGLKRSTFGAMLAGNYKTYKGWTGKYIGEEELNVV